MKPSLENKNDTHTCETYEPLLSAAMDGELTEDERQQLAGHLQQCAVCRKQEKVFRQLGNALDRHVPPAWEQVSLAPANNTVNNGTINNVNVSKSEEEIDEKPLPAKSVSSSKLDQETSRVQWVLAGITAAMLAWGALSVSSLLSSSSTPQPQAMTASAEAIAIPLTKLLWLNQESQRDQVRVIKNMEHKLRTLRLEVTSLSKESIDGEDKDRLLARVDQLLNRLKKVDVVYQRVGTRSTQ